MHKTTVLCMTLALLALGCSSGQGAPAQPAGVATYGPTSQTAPPPPPRYTQPAQPRYVQPAPRYGAAASGPFRWHSRIGDAQAQARREGKLILVGSTKPGCSLCDKFKNQVVPQAGSRVSSVVVGYMVHALTPEAPYIWQQLRANLPNAGLMPLVGVFTPDLRYLTGFGGPADNSQLMNALATARRLYPVSARAPQRTLPTQVNRVAGTTARLNEYGEYEWTPLGELFPAPQDALTPEAVVAAADPVLPPAASSPATAAAPAPVAPLPVARAPTTVATLPAPPPVPTAPVTVRRAPPVTVNRSPRSAAVTAVTPPAAPAAKAAPRPNPPFHREPEPALEAWGATALRQALQQIRDGQLDEAKSTLAEVGARMPGSTLAREAAKGTVAVYSAQRMADAQGSERDRLRAEAARNLGQTMWGVLFRS